jgi:ankyrin repeat protein
MIKKLVLGMLLAYGTVANAGTYYLDSAKKMKVDTPYNLMVIDGVTDLEMAIHVGKIDYLKEAFKVDPELARKINNVMGSAPDAPLGFNPKNPELLNFMLQYDKDLLSRRNADKRNILTNILVQHFEFYQSAEPKKEVDKLLSELSGKKLPFIKDVQVALTVGRPIPEMEKLAIAVQKALPPAMLNEGDKWGNTALHYAVYIRKPNIVKSLLDDQNFRAANTNNIQGENALFMLLNNNCNVNNDPKTEVQILKALLSARVNPFIRSEKGFSFAGIVYAFDEFSHLRLALEDNIGPLRKKIAEKEAEQIKMLLQSSSSRDVKNSLASSFSNASEYTIYTCDVKKLKY